MRHLLQWGSSPIITQELRGTRLAPKWKRILIPPGKGMYMRVGKVGTLSAQLASGWESNYTPSTT